MPDPESYYDQFIESHPQIERKGKQLPTLP